MIRKIGDEVVQMQMSRWALLLLILMGLIALVTSSGGMSLRAAEAGFKICPPENISETPGKSTHPRIAVDRSSGAIFVVWEEEEDGTGNREIYLRRLTFNPGCFSPPPDQAVSTISEKLDAVNVSNNDGDSHAPDLVLGGAQGGFVVWQDTTADEDYNPEGREAILLRRFTFTTGIDIQNTDTLNISERPDVVAGAPSIVVDGFGRSFVAWEQTPIGGEFAEIFFTSDQPYAPKVNVSTQSGWDSRIRDSRAPRLAVPPDASKVFVVWQEKLAPDLLGGWEIFFSSSGNAARRFVKPDFDDPPSNISNTSGNSVEPAIVALSQTEQLVVWSDDTPGDYDIFFRRSTEGFKPHFNISESCPQGSLGDSRQPAIALDDSEGILVVWQEDVREGVDDNLEIFFASSDFRDGEPFACLNISAEAQVSIGGQPPQPSPGASAWPALATDRSGNIFIVWEEEVGQPEGNTEIYFIALKRS